MYVQGVALNIDPCHDERGLIFQSFDSLSYFKEERAKIDPLLGQRPSKLRPESNFTVLSKIVRQHQNKSDKKIDLSKHTVLKNK